MRKVIKISGKVLSAIILSLIILVVFVLLLVNNAGVQNALVTKASRLLSERAGTTISIGRIDIRGLSRVKASDVYVEDLAGDTLLYVSSLSATLGKAAIIRGNIELDNVKVRGARLCLRTSEDGTMNLAELLDLIPKSDKAPGGKPIVLTDIEMTGSRFSFQREGADTLTAGINYGNMVLDDLDLSSRKLVILGSDIGMDLRSASFRDISGFEVRDFTAETFSLSEGMINFTDTRIATSDSSLHLDSLTLRGESWKEYSDFIDKVTMTAAVSGSAVDTRTLAWFVPVVADLNLRATDVDLSFEGVANDFKGDVTSLTLDGVRLEALFAVKNAVDIDNAEFDVEIRRLTSPGGALSELFASLTGEALPVQAAEMLARAGEVSVTGTANGNMRDVVADIAVATGLGTVSARGSMARGASGTSFEGMTDIRNFDMGRLTGNKLLGRTTLRAKGNARLAEDFLSVSADAVIPSLMVNGHNYHPVTIKGTFDNDVVTASLNSTDPDFALNIDGSVDMRDSVPSYDITLDLARADIYKLNIDRRDSLAVLRSKARIEGSGSNLDNVNGSAVISELVYTSSADSVNVDKIVFTGRNDATSKYLSLSSSFADAEFRSGMSYKDVFDYLGHVVYDYLPALDAERSADGDGVAGHAVLAERSRAADSVALRREATARTVRQGGRGRRRELPVTDTRSELHVNIKQANNIAAIFLPGFNVAEGTKADVVFDPVTERFTISAESDYMEYDRFLVTKLGLNAGNNNAEDNIFFRFTTEELYVPGFSMPSNEITARAKDNKVTLRAKLSDERTSVNALLNVAAEVGRDEHLFVKGTIDSSRVMTGKEEWVVRSKEIRYDTTKIVVNDFEVRNRGLGMHVDGTASALAGDTLRLTLDEFDIRPLALLFARRNIDVTGKLDGGAQVCAALGTPLMTADIRIDSLSLNGHRAAPLRLTSSWDFSAERARMALRNERSGDNVVRGFYSPTGNSYFASAVLENVPLAVAETLAPGMVSGTQGFADVIAEVRSDTEGRPEVKGNVNIYDLTTTVDFNKVTYKIDKASVGVENNMVTLPSFAVTDHEGNTAQMSAGADINDLSNVAYHARIVPGNLLVLNTRAGDNDLFYGKAYVSGAVDLRGDRMGVNLDVAASTGAGSAIYLPLSGKSSVSNTDFVVFRSDTADFSTLDVLERKKLIYERSLRGGATGGAEMNMNINVALTVTPNTLVSIAVDQNTGNVLNARGNATLNLGVNPSTKEFLLFGTYEVAEGEYMLSMPPVISNKRFTIRPGGTIQWSGEPMDAMLDIEAVYRLRTSLAPLEIDTETGDIATARVPVDCIIRIRESLSQPDISFEVTAPTADVDVRNALTAALNTSETMATQFLWLVGLGSFAPSSNQNISGTMGNMNTSAIGFDFLASQLSNILSTNQTSIIFRYRPQDEYSSDEIDFGFSRELISNRLILEVEGNYDVGNNPTSAAANRANSMSGDASLTWVLTPSGNIRLKGFTRTIDRFDENQGLQENGVGIYYREDFNRFSDIARTAERRREARRAKRAERRAVKAAEKAASGSTGSGDDGATGGGTTTGTAGSTAGGNSDNGVGTDGSISTTDGSGAKSSGTAGGAQAGVTNGAGAAARAEADRAARRAEEEMRRQERILRRRARQAADSL